jgi:hypothetical protein
MVILSITVTPRAPTFTQKAAVAGRRLPRDGSVQVRGDRVMKIKHTVDGINHLEKY